MSTIAPNDANLLYSPYTWKVEAGKATTTSSGAYVKATIEGATTDLAMLFDLTNLSTTRASIVYRVDAGPWTRLSVAATSYALTLDSTWPVHIVEIVVAVRGGTTPIWPAPPNGAVQFAGFSSTTTITTRKVQDRPLYGFALGDSLDMGILAGGATLNDARYGWGYPLREALGAEVGIRGFGGVGLAQAGDGGVPKFGTIWNQLWEGQPADFTTRPPDFIVTMPGTNDFTAAATITEETVALLNAMIAATPASCPIFVVRTLKGSNVAAIQAGIAGCSTPSRVTWVDTTGWWVAADSVDGTHPYGYVNVNDVAPRLAKAMFPVIVGSKLPAVTRYRWDGAAWMPVVGR